VTTQQGWKKAPVKISAYQIWNWFHDIECPWSQHKQSQRGHHERVHQRVHHKPSNHKEVGNYIRRETRRKKGRECEWQRQRTINAKSHGQSCQDQAPVTKFTFEIAITSAIAHLCR
jgi:hypothetical protein